MPSGGGPPRPARPRGAGPGPASGASGPGRAERAYLGISLYILDLVEYMFVFVWYMFWLFLDYLFGNWIKHASVSRLNVC